MNTTELPAMIRECVDGGAEPISPAEARARAVITERRVRPAPVRRGTRLGVAATGLAVTGIAGTLVASQLGGATAAGSRAMLTAAMLKQVTEASQTAMTSGQARIVTATGGSVLVQQVSFDGANWNDVTDPGTPAQIHRTPGAITRTGESISRVVGGQAYRYPAFLPTPTPHYAAEWMQLTVGAAKSLDVPDPRTLLSALSPSARFVSDGYTTVNGARAEILQASRPGAVPLQPLQALISTEPDNPQVSGLSLWVDSSHVVLRAEFGVTGPDTALKLTPAGVQAVQHYIKQRGITVSAKLLRQMLNNPAMLSAWAGARAASDTGLASLLRRPGMASTEHVTPTGVTVTVTFSQIGQPQNITAPAHYITAGSNG